MHTDVNENSDSTINGGTNGADVGVIDKAQASTSVGAEMPVERQEPLKAGNTEFEDAQEHAAGTDDFGIIDSQVYIRLMVQME